MIDVGRTYVIAATAAVTAQVDLCEVVSASDAVTIIESVEISQSSDTDSEALGIQFVRGFTSSGSGGSSATPTPDDPGDAAFAGTAEVFNTTLASTSGTVMLESGWNVLSPWIWPSGPAGLVLSPSQRWVVKLTAAPADSLTMRINVRIREIGS